MTTNRYMYSSKLKYVMSGFKSHMNLYLCHGSVNMRKGTVSLSELVISGDTVNALLLMDVVK